MHWEWFQSLIFLLYVFMNFETLLTDGKMNNIIILQHQKPWCFSPINLKWAPVFVLNLKYWYLSKMISFLKCPFIPTFLLLIKARRCYEKWKDFLSRSYSLGSFCDIFQHAYLHFLILISQKENRRSHLKLFTLFLKKKKWNETRWEWNLVLNNEMRMNDMKTKPYI